ncbi:MAG TPA: hypothetical protein VFH66_12655 [Mycobacteriales bacterium]|nr:hypothetical protein [Mycobacteriales bacterium]
MMRHHPRRRHSQQPLLYVLPEFVDLPTGNVHLVPFDHADDEVEIRQVPGDSSPTTEWVIRDVTGKTLESLTGSRAHALRRMSALAGQGAGLPLSLYAPDGLATGDRLPG